MTAYDPKAWEWWQDRLDGKEPPIYNDTPMTGYYAFQPGGKKERPRAVIFYYSATSSGALITKIDGAPVKYGLDIWPQCSRNPISHDVYKQVVDGKSPWPHEIQIITADGRTDSTLAGPGDNSGDDFQTITGNLREWIDRAKAAVKKGAPDTQEEADAIADIATKLSDLKAEAERLRVAETDPLHKVWKMAVEKWSVHIKPAEPLIANLKSLGYVYLQREKKRREDAARATNEAAAAAAKKAGDDTPQVAPVQAAPVRIGTRKAVSTVKRDVVVFDDFQKAAAYFCSQENVAEHIREAIERSAFQALKAGVAIPGAKLEKKEGAR